MNLFRTGIRIDTTLIFILWLSGSVVMYLVFRIPRPKWQGRWVCWIPFGGWINRFAQINLVIVKLFCVAIAFHWLVYRRKF